MNANRIRELLDFIYGENEAAEIFPGLMEIVGKPAPAAAAERAITNKDALLISYGDMLSAGGGGGEETALRRLGRFLSKWNDGDAGFSYLHLLPFHPYSSDDGFSVIDYRVIDPKLGGWDDVEKLGGHFKTVFDFVINHGSAQSEWFKKFLAGEPPYQNWYATRPDNYDWSKVFRPRTHPLFTAFTKSDGSKVNVWTTFSADQVDYDFSRQEVVLEFIRIFLDYCKRGAKMLRLDAIAFMWKEDGTACMHHPKTHAFVKLLRAIIDYLQLPVLLLTETNVPHRDNISYFGGDLAIDVPGKAPDMEEAHMVYNFALPPLVLHAAVSGDALPLRRWAESLPALPAGNCFLNFLASHDGVGLGAAKGLIDDAAFAETLAFAKTQGALVSMKSTPAGEIPYELNCSWADMVAPESLGSVEVQARAFLATYAVAMALPGLPAVYFHSWIGSRAWKEGPSLWGYNRAINREKPAIDSVEKELGEKGSFRAHIMEGFARMLEFKAREPAFAPDVPCKVLQVEPAGVFALCRQLSEAEGVLCLHNFSRQAVKFKVDLPPFKREISLDAHATAWVSYRGGGDIDLSDHGIANDPGSSHLTVLEF
ncbi:MAG: alpha-amylase family glycosyl hydrolase [Spirochaetes bacterium]|nr:alpha-amylase family glycosyl hydrolase [Spirochaetota bacterium]